jgi:hypothetical protein
MYRKPTHQATHAQHEHSSLSDVYTLFLSGRRQCQRRPLSVAPNFHAERSSPPIAGYLNISTCTMLNTLKLSAKRILLFAVRPNVLNLLSIVNSMLTMIQVKTWTHFPTPNTMNKSQTRGIKDRHFPCRGRTQTPAQALHLSISLLSNRISMLSVSL